MAEKITLDSVVSIIQQNYLFYKQLQQPKIDANRYTVLASLNRLSDNKLLALSTGTQACLKKYRDDIQDCHAESLLKRAYKRYLIDLIRHDYDSTKTLTHFELMLFVSQFPCGLTNKYKGDEPTDSDGNTIRRKPGRGVTQDDGTIVYVPKLPCIDKIVKWLVEGYQGKRLAKVTGIKSKLTLIVVGGCECSSAEVNDNIECDKFKEILAKNYHDELPRIISLPLFKPEEFIRNSMKEPHPISTIWWSSCEHDNKINSNLELLVDGRKMGLTFKSLQTGKYRPLKVADSSINQDIDCIMQI